MGNDLHLKNELENQFQKLKQDSGVFTNFKVTVLEVKIILSRILKSEMLRVTANLDEHCDEDNYLNSGLNSKKTGDYSGGLIKQI